MQPFLDAWRNAGEKGLVSYRAGSEGPEEVRSAAGARRPALAIDRLKDCAMEREHPHLIVAADAAAEPDRAAAPEHRNVV